MGPLATAFKDLYSASQANRFVLNFCFDTAFKIGQSETLLLNHGNNPHGGNFGRP